MPLAYLELYVHYRSYASLRYSFTHICQLACQRFLVGPSLHTLDKLINRGFLKGKQILFLKRSQAANTARSLFYLRNIFEQIIFVCSIACIIEPTPQTPEFRWRFLRIAQCAGDKPAWLPIIALLIDLCRNLAQSS